MAERIQGRGSSYNPGNRFERIQVDELSDEFREEAPATKVPTVYYHDASRSILARNDSPDVPFTYSINPYRGCEHGCIYCYARPSHEYLGMSAGLDFESRILVKMDAAKLLDEALQDPKFEPQVIALSGNTDCYQPAERKFQLTRACLEVFLKYRNPVGIITKSALVTRDLDILQEMARLDLAAVTLSITTLDPVLAAKMEPRASIPEKRLEAVRELSRAGVPTCVNVAPIIPGLTDREIPEILERSAECGAQFAAHIMVRLPYAVKDLFQEWVAREYPSRAGKILGRIKDIRGGNLSDPRFNSRMTGEGEFAEAITTLFRACCKKNGLNESDFELTTAHFQRPGQIALFD